MLCTWDTLSFLCFCSKIWRSNPVLGACLAGTLQLTHVPIPETHSGFTDRDRLTVRRYTCQQHEKAQWLGTSARADWDQTCKEVCSRMTQGGPGRRGGPRVCPWQQAQNTGRTGRTERADGQLTQTVGDLPSGLLDPSCLASVSPSVGWWWVPSPEGCHEGQLVT